MLSTRGAITTNVALVECAAGQSKADKSVFLLSELEKVWVSVAVVARRLLLDGHAVQINSFGALWTEEYVLLHDRQQRPYTTRKLCFGINQNFANRYGVDTSKVPLEKRSGSGYVRVSMADVVAVCGIPARTAATALKEFILYLGEGLSRGRIFHLSLPGVCTIAMKQQKVALTMNEELRNAMFDIDSRKWAVELKAEGLKALENLAAIPASGIVSVQSSRPSTSRLSRLSWRPAPASTSLSAGDAATSPRIGAEKKSVFIAAAPSGRTFEEIAQQAEQRRKAAQQAASVERDMRRRQADLDRRIQHYHSHSESHADPMREDEQFYDEDERRTYTYDDVEDAEAHNVVGVDDDQRRSLRPPSASGESIYHILNEGENSSRAPPCQYGRQRRPHAPSPRNHAADEPEVQVIEMINDEDAHGMETGIDEAAEMRERRPLAHKDPELERVLREEEAFSRPISRRTYHEMCAARDLIYSQPYEAPERASSSSAAGPSPMYRPPCKVDGEVTHTGGERAAPVQASAASRARAQQENVPRFGRKRFEGNHYSDDHVGSLLQYRA
jgi:hypothetical protein